MENYSIVFSSLTGNTKSCQSADRSVYTADSPGGMSAVLFF